MMSPSSWAVSRTCAYSRTTGINTFTGKKLLIFVTGPPRMLVDLEAIDHILEINVFGIFDVEVGDGEVKDGCCWRRSVRVCAACSGRGETHTIGRPCEIGIQVVFIPASSLVIT